MKSLSFPERSGEIDMAEVSSQMIEVCPFRIRGDRPEFLLIRRAPGESMYPGLWQFVTGRVEKGEKASAAALRELKEETGAAPVGFWVVPAVNSFYDPGEDRIALVPIFAAQIDPAFDVRLSAEHGEHEWLAYDVAARRLVWPGQRSCLDIVQRYIVGGEEAGTLLRIS
jgi:8-oxo-dGTP pyrophosphatase MutT (NUDIX family)